MKTIEYTLSDLVAFMTNYDNYSQMAGDEGNEELCKMFDDAFCEIEKFKRKLASGQVLTTDDHNTIRMTIKHYWKLTPEHFILNDNTEVKFTKEELLRIKAVELAKSKNAQPSVSMFLAENIYDFIKDGKVMFGSTLGSGPQKVIS